MKVEHVNEGPKILYRVRGNGITFGEDDLTINLENRQKEEENLLDICADEDGFLVIGAAVGRRYVAQIVIPAKGYPEMTEESEEEAGLAERTEPPFSMDDCIIRLWALKEEN